MQHETLNYLQKQIKDTHMAKAKADTDHRAFVMMAQQ